MKKTIVLSCAFIVSVCFSCDNESPNPDIDSEFAELSMEIFGTLSDSYPKGDILLNVGQNTDGSQTALYQLTGETKELVQLGSFAARVVEDGTECNGGLSCAKAIKECLDNNLDALISNGACATYCVKCQEPD